MPKIETCEMCRREIQPQETAFLLNGETVVCRACRDKSFSPINQEFVRRPPERQKGNAVAMRTRPTAWVVTVLGLACGLTLLGGLIIMLNAVSSEHPPGFGILAIFAIGCASLALFWAILAQCVNTLFERLAQIVAALEHPEL